MSNELLALIGRVEGSDPALAEALRRQFEVLSKRRDFGLNFERHVPEQVALVGRPITVGDKVCFVPPRGETTVESVATWVVTKITGARNSRAADLLDPQSKAEGTRALDDLVFVADFRDPIYPGFRSVGRLSEAETNRSTQ